MLGRSGFKDDLEQNFCIPVPFVKEGMCYKLLELEWRANVNIANMAIITGKVAAFNGTSFCPQMSVSMSFRVCLHRKAKHRRGSLCLKYYYSLMRLLLKMWGNKFIKIGSKRQSNGSVLRMLICRIGMPIGIVKHTKKVAQFFLQKVETEVGDIKMQQSKKNEDGDDEAVG